MDAPKPYGDNYENVSQNTEEWQRLQNYKVTGIRLPALLGFYRSIKYNDDSWNIVKNRKSELLKLIRNIARGH